MRKAEGGRDNIHLGTAWLIRNRKPTSLTNKRYCWTCFDFLNAESTSANALSISFLARRA
jgi:hypothetical protein